MQFTGLVWLTERQRPALHDCAAHAPSYAHGQSMGKVRAKRTQHTGDLTRAARQTLSMHSTPDTQRVSDAALHKLAAPPA